YLPPQAEKPPLPCAWAASRLGRLELRARVTSAAVRSCHCVLVAAAAAPLPGGRPGGRVLSLRVSTLGSREHECCHFAPSSSRCSVVQVISRNPGALRTVVRWSFVLDRRTGEAAASRPH